MRKGLFSIMCAALVAAVSAAPSWSQTIGGSAAPQYAKEIFGGGANPVLTLGTNGNVTVTYDLTSTTIVGARNADITFTLSAGTFADPPNLLSFTGANSTSITVTTKSGSVGSSSITYGLRTTANLPTTGSLVFTFTIPRITGVGSVLGAATPANPDVSIGVAVAPDSATQPSGFPMFPAMTTTVDARKHVIAGSALAVNPVTLLPAPGATSTVQIIDINDRTMTAGTDPAAATISGLPSGSRTVGIRLSNIVAARNQAPVRADGSTGFLSAPGTSSGKLIVTAEGSFGTGDILFFSIDTTYAASEALSVSGRTATASIPLSSAAGGAFANPYFLYYVPATGVLSQETISVSYRMEWMLGDDEYADTMLPVGPTAITFEGIRDVAYAYAIPNPTHPDVGNLRIRCQGELECDVFLDCMDTEGNRIGNGNLTEITLPGNTLGKYSTKTNLLTLLGVSSWEGRLSCNIMSNRNISVQILTRSGGTLVNNTYISGLDPDPDNLAD